MRNTRTYFYEVNFSVMLRFLSTVVEIENHVKIRRARLLRRTLMSSCQHTRIGGRPQFLITNAKLNMQHNVHMLRVGYELARFCRVSSFRPEVARDIGELLRDIAGKVIGVITGHCNFGYCTEPSTVVWKLLMITL